MPVWMDNAKQNVQFGGRPLFQATFDLRTNHEINHVAFGCYVLTRRNVSKRLM